MPHDPRPWWVYDPDVDREEARREAAPPPDPDGNLTARHGDSLGRIQPCLHCGRPVRRIDEQSRRVMRLSYDVEGPVDPAAVTDPHWPASWWHPVNGLSDRINLLPQDDPRHQARGSVLYVMHPCVVLRHRPGAAPQPPAPAPDPAPPIPQREEHMTTPDPFAGGDGVPAVSFKEAPIGTTITLTVTKAPELVQELVYGTKDKATWPLKVGETGPPQPKMAAVVQGLVDGEERALWASKPSAMFAAIKEAQVAAGATIAPGGTLSVRFTALEPTTNAAFNDKKLYQAHYAPPSVFGEQAAPAPAAAPVAAPVADFPPAAPATPAQPVAAAAAPPWATQ